MCVTCAWQPRCCAPTNGVHCILGCSRCWAGLRPGCNTRPLYTRTAPTQSAKLYRCVHPSMLFPVSVSHPLLLCLAGGSAAVQHTASRCAQAQEGRNMRATRVRPQGGVGPAIPGRVYAEREGRDGIFQQHWYIHTSALPAHPPCPVPSMNEHRQ